MSDPIVEARVDRAVESVRKSWVTLYKRPTDDEDLRLLAILRRELVRAYSLEKSIRERKRKRYEMTRDIFEQAS